VQEIGHLADLWSHSSDPNNVMTDQPGGTADQITTFQCCMLRTSRFSSALPCPRLPEIGRRAGDLRPVEPQRPEPLEELPAREVSHGFQRLRRGDGERVDLAGVATAGLALAALAWFVRRIIAR
jgi:hypothetical protein